VLGLLAFIAQPVDYRETGATTELGLWVLASAVVVAAVSTALITRLAVAYDVLDGLFRLGQLVAPITLGLTVGLAVPLVQPVRPPPVATVLYQISAPIGADDGRFGRPGAATPGPQPPLDPYDPTATRGYGYPVAVDIARTRLVYEHSCAAHGQRARCGGNERARFYTTTDEPPDLWARPVDRAVVVARLLDPDPDGGCAAGYAPLHRYALPSEDGAALRTVALRAPGPQWQQEEMLGCIWPIG
jgi:hypothetical protein